MSYQSQPNQANLMTDPTQDRFSTINIVETKMLYLSTKSSQCTQLNGDAKSYVSFNLRSFLDFQGDDSIQSVSIALTNAILCNSNYQVNQYNNKLDINLNGTTTSYYFEYGNYNAETFMQEFTVLVPSTFSITYDQISLKFIITNSAYPFTLLSSSTISAIMGFSNNVVATNTVGSTYVAQCTRLMNMLPTPCFRVLCEANNLYFGTVLGTDGSPAISNVLAHIPNNSQPNQLIYYQTFSDEFYVEPNTSGQTILILKIVDDNSNLVDFNGISSYFTFRIRIYRKQPRLRVGFMDLAAQATNLNLAMQEGEIIEKPLANII